MADELAPLNDDDRQLCEATCDLLGLEESAKTAMLSRTHAPIGKGGSNWITRSKPGNTGQLPAYIQNVRNAIMRDGTSESRATAIAVGRVRDWAQGKGDVSAEVREASRKAIAEWDRMRASSHATKETAARRLPRAKAVPRRPAADAEALALTFELGVLETAANPGVTRFGHPVTSKSYAGQQRPAAKKTTTRSGRGAYDSKAHPRGRGGEWTLKDGAAGDLVRVVQRRVGARADGQYGAMTRQSVMEFQRRHGLTADGVVGRQTIAAMRGDANAQHVMPGGATLADRRWLAGRAAMRRVREGAPPAPRRARARTAVVETTGALALKVDSSLRLVESVDLSIHEEIGWPLVETADGHSTSLDLAVLEATADADVKFNPDGTVDMVIIRPCAGRGVGSRIYEAVMLEQFAPTFSGLPSYDNHESPAAKRARQGLPRPPSELAGEIREAWWDSTFTTPQDEEMDFGRGAVIGRFMLTEDMEKLVRRLPRAIKTSVNTEATGLRAGTWRGRKGAIVEGFINDPEQHSVDLVTRAGAGGAVASLYRDLATA